MYLIPCPGCGMPRAPEDIDRPCPLCGGEPTAVPPAMSRAPVTAPSAALHPMPKPARGVRVLLFALAILLPVGAGVVVYALWPAAEPGTTVEPPPRPPAPLPKRVATARLEVAPSPRVAVAPPVPLPVEPIMEPADGVIVLNKPYGEYILPAANGAASPRNSVGSN